MSGSKKFIQRNIRSLSNLVAVTFGLFAGLIFKSLMWPDGRVDQLVVRYLELPGAIYMRVFTMLLAPLLIASLSTSFIGDKQQVTANGDGSTSPESHFDINRVITITFILIIIFSTCTASLGATAIAIFQPGHTPLRFGYNKTMNQTAEQIHLDELANVQKSIQRSYMQVDSLYNVFYNIFPNDLVTSLFMNTFIKTNIIWPQNLTNITDPNYLPKTQIKSVEMFRANVLGICLISLGFGIILHRMEASKTEMLRKILLEVQAVVFYVIDLFIKVMPIGSFCWIFTESFKIESLSAVASQLIYLFSLAVLLFLFLWFVMYPTIYFVVTRQNPFRVHVAILPAMVVAAASCSSAVTLPITMKCMEGARMRLPKMISQVVLPLGMTINMNGAAMYFPMIGIFVAQMKNVSISFIPVCIVCLFSVIMSMGLPALPNGGTGVIVHFAIASILGVENPQNVIALVHAFDWILEHFRTVTNVMGDCFVSKCVEKLAKSKSPSTVEVIITEESSEPTQSEITDGNIPLQTIRL